MREQDKAQSPDAASFIARLKTSWRYKNIKTRFKNNIKFASLLDFEDEMRCLTKGKGGIRKFHNIDQYNDKEIIM